MQSVFSKLASLGVLGLGLALIPATLPAQTSRSAGSGNQAATAPAANQNSNAANPANNNDQNGNAVNPNNNPNQAAVPPAGTANATNTGGNNGGGGSWGLWGLVGLLGLFGLARGRGRASYVETRDRERDINDRRVA